MKTRLPALLALVVAFSASAFADPSPAPAATDRAFGFTVSAVTLPDQAEITHDTTRMTVRRLMGAAQRELSPDVWVYFGYHPNVADGNERGCDTLVISFADGKVSDLKIVNARATTVIAANLKRATAATLVAQK